MPNRHAEDRCRPFGIPFDREALLPPDDDQTELLAWINGKFDSAFADVRSHGFDV